MANGGGAWVTQNKVLPGSYINFVSASRASSVLSERGIAALAVEMDWGPEGRAFKVDAETFADNAKRLFGYEYGNDALKGLRDLFRHARTAFLYRLNSNGTKASNAYATAKFSGVRGNSIKIVIEPNELYTEESPVYDVSTLLDNSSMEKQTVRGAGELKENDFVTFIAAATLEPTAGMPLVGGTNGTVENAAHQYFLNWAESLTFHTLGCLSTDSTVKSLYAAFTRRMRDENGVKFQTVMHRHAADYEGVVSVENNDTPEAVYWVVGALAGCTVNASTSNLPYDGEYEINTEYTQRQLELAIKGGKYIFHNAYGEARVLTDINTLVTYTEDKGQDFSSNQTVRVLDQIGNDIAVLFNTQYRGKIPNDASGRVSLWNDIVRHHQQLEQMRAIEAFDPAKVVVQPGENKKAVMVGDVVTPVNAMEQLYMTVVVQ